MPRDVLRLLVTVAAMALANIACAHPSRVVSLDSKSDERCRPAEAEKSMCFSGVVKDSNGSPISGAYVSVITDEQWREAHGPELRELDRRQAAEAEYVDFDRGAEFAVTKGDGSFCIFMRPTRLFLLEIRKNGYRGLVRIIDRGTGYGVFVLEAR